MKTSRVEAGGGRQRTKNCVTTDGRQVYRYYNGDPHGNILGQKLETRRTKVNTKKRRSRRPTKRFKALEV